MVRAHVRLATAAAAAAAPPLLLLLFLPLMDAAFVHRPAQNIAVRLAAGSGASARLAAATSTEGV